jgi:hypothetical protein
MYDTGRGNTTTRALAQSFVRCKHGCRNFQRAKLLWCEDVLEEYKRTLDQNSNLVETPQSFTSRSKSMEFGANNFMVKYFIFVMNQIIYMINTIF